MAKPKRAEVVKLMTDIQKLWDEEIEILHRARGLGFTTDDNDAESPLTSLFDDLKESIRR